MQSLYETEYLTIEYEPERDLLFLRRTAIPMPGPEQLPALFTGMLNALADYAGKPLLMDLRLGRGNNSPDFELGRAADGLSAAARLR